MKKYFCITIIILIFFTNLFGQTKIDSLEAQLTIVKKQKKVEVLNELAKAYLSISPEKSLEYAKQGLELSEKLDYIKGKEECFNNLGATYYNLCDYNKALEYYQKALKVREEIGDKKSIANSLSSIGLVYDDLSNYNKALEYYQKALKVREEIGDKKGIAYSLNNIGVVYDNLVNYDKALEYYLKALKIYEEIEDKKGKANSLNNIGVVYWNLANNDKALEYYLKALRIREEIGDKKSIAASLNNIGIVYNVLKNYNKALVYYLKSLKIKEELEDKHGIGSTLSNIGLVYSDLSNYEKALECHQKSLKIREEIGDKKGIAISFTNIGVHHLKLRNYDNSLSNLEKGLKLAKEIKAKDLILYIQKSLSELYSGKANYKKALENFKLYAELKDSIFTEESSEKIAEMQTKYETEKKEKENEILRKNNEIQKLEITRQQNLRNSFIAISVLVLILMVVIYSHYRIKQKANKILTEKNIQINKQKNQLAKTLKELQETQKMLVDTAHRAGMAEIASGILHNVGNVLNSVKVSSQILKEKIEKSKVSSLEKALNLMEEHTSDLSNYITSDEKGKILPTYLIKVGKVLKDEQDSSLKEISDLHSGINHIEEIVAVQQNYAGVSGIVESVSLSKMMDDVLRMYQDSFTQHKIKVIKNYDKTKLVSIEKGKLIQVFVNLLKNAQESLILTESENKAITINISKNKENKSQMVEITDNGVGIKKDNLKRIFSYGFTTKKDSQGFGLHTSALAMAELKGKLLAYSDGEGMGAKFTAIIPIQRKQNRNKIFQ